MKNLSIYSKNFIVLLMAFIFSIMATNKLQAQSCNQVDILYTSIDCFERSTSPVGNSEKGCKETAVCFGQAYTYSSSLNGGGWTYNWTATGPTAVTISPNNTQSVSIIWPQIGDFILTLTATDPSGNVFTTCLTVHVIERPNANFTFSPNNVCAGSIITFTGTTTYSGSFMSSWDFGDLPSGSLNYQTVSGNTPVTHQYNTAGSYWVTLITSSFTVVTVPGGNGAGMDTVIKTCCSDTIRKLVTILAGTIKIDCISTVCAGSTSTYTISGCANPTVTIAGNTSFTQSGNQITVVWGNGTPQGQITASCPGSCTASVPVPIIPTTPQIIGNINPCNTSTTSYSLPVLPGTFYTWTLLNTTNGLYYNSAINTYPDNNTVFIKWNSIPAGVYQLGVTLENKHICCKTTGSLTITPRGKWKPYFDQTICAGSTASLTATPGGTYAWTVLPPNGGVTPTSGTGSTFTPIPTFTNAGIYTVQAIETAGIFCNSGTTNPQQVKVTVRPVLVPGVINGPDKVCAGSNYDYTMSTPAPSGTHYEWTITGGAGTFLPTGTPPIMGDNVTIQWTTIPGTISVVLKYNDFPYCPVGPVTKTVTAATVGTISGNQNVCVDDQLTYTLTGGTLAPGEVINWVITPSSLGSVILGNGTNMPTIKWHGMVAGSGPWTAQLQATTNCGNTALYPITISRPPVFSLSQTGNICMGGVNLSATNTPGYAYSWSPGVHPATSTINVTTVGTYTCTVTNGTCSKTKTITVYDPFAILPIQECGGPHCNGLATSEQLQISVIKPASGLFTYQWFKQYPTVVSVSGPTPLGPSLSNIYMAADSGYYFVVVTYGSCKDTAYYYVQKECCPDVNTPQITTVRNSCNDFTFTGTTPNPTGASITWDFGDGTTQPGISGVPVAHNYVNAGSYCVTFCVGPPSTNPTNCYGNCAGTNVIVPIQAKFNVTMGCNGCVKIENLSTVIPLGASTITYTWNFGDGPSLPATSSSIPPSHCYTTAGPYTIILTIKISDPSLPAPCLSSYSVNVTYTPLSITINPTPVCSGNLVTFTSTPGGFASYAWNFGDTYSSYTSPTTHAYTTPSPPTYNVILTVVDLLGITCTATKPVTVLAGISSCKILPAFICPGSAATLTAPAGAYTYLWQVETSPGVFVNASGTNTNATYNTTIPGYYHVIVTNSNGCSCTSNKVQVKAVTKPKALIAVSPSAKLCGPGSVMLNSVNHLPGFTSEWYQNNVYSTPQTGQYWSPSISTTTVFNLVLTNQYGCKDTCTMTVYVNPIPAQPIIAAPALLCEGVPITLTVTNYASNITWNTGANTLSITVVAAGAYTATYTDPTTGCQSTQTVTIHPRPSTQLFPHFCDSIKCTCRNPDGTFTVYAPKPLVGIFANTYNIAWYYNGNLVGANANNPLFNPAQTGSYYVILTNPITGCKDTSNTYSIVVPPCDTCDCAESHWGEISLSEGADATKLANGKNKTNVKEKNSKIANPLPNTVLDCKAVYTIKCNQPYTINANYICKDTSCPSKVTYSLLLPDNSIQTGNVPYSFTPTQSGNYALTLYGWCGGKICDSCLITFKVECIPPPKDCCKGSYWKEEPYYYIGATGTVKPKKIDCTKETVILITGDDCKKPLVVGSIIQCPTADCGSKDSVFVYDGAGNIALSGSAPLTITGLANGNYTVVLNGYCGGKLCLTCKFFIKIDCNQKECNCKGSQWGEKVVTINNASQSIVCGKNYIAKCKTPVSINANYICADASCPGTVTYTLVQPSGITSGNVPLNFTPTQNGIYTVTLFGMCGTTKCDSCVIKFSVRDCPVDTNCCKDVITITNTQPKPTYTSTPTSTIVTNNFTISGIPASKNITEVRANVVSYTIDDDFKGDCMKCVNLPFSWASTSTATNIATAPPKITMYGGATVPSFNGSGTGAYQNPREIIWNNGTNLNSPNITNIGISFILPPTPAIDCCKLKGKICVKFTFRDEKCNECEVIGCFDFVIKK